MNEQQENLKKLVKSLNQKPVAYYPIYREIMGSIAGGVMLSQIMFWWGVAKGDEFYKSDSELMKETGLNEWEIKNEKYKLKSLPFIKFERKGVPPTTHYSIDIEKFNDTIVNSEHVLRIGSIRRPRSKSKSSTFSEYIKSTCSESTGSACSESYINTENTKRVSEIKKTAPNGAEKNIPSGNVKAKDGDSRSNFEKLIDWWYQCKGEPTPPGPPPRYKGKRFMTVVSERIDEQPDKNAAWKKFADSIKCYWAVVKSDAHYYDYRGDISWFMGEGIDKFSNPKEAWENFKKKNNDGKVQINQTTGNPVIAPWQKRWNPLEQKGLVQNAATTS